MASVNDSNTPNVEPNVSQDTVPKENDSKDNIKVSDSHLLSSHERHILTDELNCLKKVAGTETLDKGYLKHGCSHYRRRCFMKAPCCDNLFDCHHCHNQTINSVLLFKEFRHDVPRHSVEKVICYLCFTEQEVQQFCANCGVCMGRYYCSICHLFEDDTSKELYHCDACGVCRTAGPENFVRCDTCGLCIFEVVTDCNPCVERGIHQNCAVCMKPCGGEIQEHYRPYTCPRCSTSTDYLPKECDVEVAPRSIPFNH